MREIISVFLLSQDTYTSPDVSIYEVAPVTFLDLTPCESPSAAPHPSSPVTLTSTLVTGIKFPRSNRLSPPKSYIELRFSASNLINSDVFSLSDPFAVIYLLDTYTGDLFEIGRTETILDDLNPRWTSSLVIPANIDVNTELVIDIYDRDGASATLTKHDHLGRATFAITDLSSTQCSCLLETAGANVPRKKSNLLTTFRAARGTLKVFAEQIHNISHYQPSSADINGNIREERVEFKLRAAALRHRRRGGGDLIQFWELSRYNIQDGDWTVIYRSEDGVQVDRYGYTRYKTTRMSHQFLSNNSPNRPLRITFFIRQTRKAHSPIACFETNSEALLQRQVIPLVAVPTLSTKNNNVDDRISIVSNTTITSISTSSKSAVFPTAPLDATPVGEVYVENISKNGNITQVQMLADHQSSRSYFSLAQDTSGQERNVRQTPDFIKLH